MSVPAPYSHGSHRKVLWQCDCGKTTTLPICVVLCGNTTSCGRCNELSAEHFEKTKYGKLKLKEPRNLLPGSRSKVEWLCDCGKETSVQPLAVIRGHTTSCGRCSDFPDSYWAVTKYGKLKIADPVNVHSQSYQKILWACDCGKTIRIPMSRVLNHNVRSCGHCSELPISHWSENFYGKLKLKEPKELHPTSDEQVYWDCKCGDSILASAKSVTSGKVRSCESCKFVPKIPITTVFVPNEVNKPTPFIATCPICQVEYLTSWAEIVSNGSCGCELKSEAQVEISSYINSLGIETISNYQISSFEYDIYVPSQNLLIGYNNLILDSGIGAKQKGVRKYRNAISHGFAYLSIFEDEWIYNHHKIKALLLNRFNLNKPISLRPSKCSISKIDLHEADNFYERNHYIGKCRSSLNYGVFYQNALISCMSFKNPTRQSKHPWELVRMASDSRYRVHGIWSTLLKTFILEKSPASIVSFSDNRLFPGNVYEKIGFKFDGEVIPDYYWCKNTNRHHKSGLRKKTHEKDSGLTEYQLREAQGFVRVWDLGKKRWIYETKSVPKPVSFMSTLL